MAKCKCKRANPQEVYLQNFQETFGILLIATASDPSETMRRAVVDALNCVADYMDSVYDFWCGVDGAEDELNDILDGWERTIGDHSPYGVDIKKFVFAVAGLFHPPEELEKIGKGK